MRQQWRDLLFAHWRVDPTLIQKRLPQGLRVDTWRDSAFLGVVPFRMAQVRVGPLPAIPGFSHLLELNLRTYVVDKAGVRGVWFFTLDANHATAVAIARTFFHLPYHRAVQSVQRDGPSKLTFRSRRCSGTELGQSTLRWQLGHDLPAAVAGELTHFLVERYVLYTHLQRRVFRGRIAHLPYRLREVEVMLDAAPLFRAHQFEPPLGPPDHVVASDGTDVSILDFEEIGD